METRFWGRFFVGVALCGILVFLFQVWNIVLPFLVGLGLAYMLNPLINRFVARGLRRDRVVFVMFIFLIGFMILLSIFFIPLLSRELFSILKEIPNYKASFEHLLTHVNERAQVHLSPFLGESAKQFVISFHSEKILGRFLMNFLSNILNAAHWVIWIVVIPFSCFFGLKDGEKWNRILFNNTPSHYVESLLSFLAEINTTLGGYVRGQLLEASCVGGVTMVGLWLLGFKGALIMGLITGLFNFVPFLAAIAGGGIALIAAYFQGLPTNILIAIALLYLVIRLLDDFLFIPLVLGSSVQLNPLVMVFSILAGSELAGFVGLILAIPVAAMIKVVLGVIIDHRKDNILIEEKHIYS
ncbi:MAG: AI-2E family transporter [Elusimicrobiota bacterium]